MATNEETQKSKLKKFMQTEEYKALKKLEKSMDMRLDGIAFFLANNLVIKSDEKGKEPAGEEEANEG